MTSDERKKLINTLDRVIAQRRITTMSVQALQLNVNRLDDQTKRIGFSKKSYDKQDRHMRRLAEARKNLRSKTAELNNIEAEVNRLNQQLAG